jgi:hypothetical protein
MPDPPIPPEATICVWTCDECGRRWLGEPPSPRDHRFCHGGVRPRVYVDLTAVDRDAWAERAARVLDPVHRRPLATDEALARAVVDGLLGPEDDRAR